MFVASAEKGKSNRDSSKIDFSDELGYGGDKLEVRPPRKSRAKKGGEKTIDEEKNGWFQQRKLEERLDRLSHPYPTVMIDRVTEVEREKTIQTTKWVSADEFYLIGHFPGEPIMPGVLTLEGLIQSALILVDESFSRGRLKCSVEKVDRVRFKKAVLPGDQVDFQLQLTAKDENLWKFKGKAQVGKETAAEADIVLKVTFRDVGFEV